MKIRNRAQGRIYRKHNQTNNFEWFKRMESKVLLCQIIPGKMVFIPRIKRITTDLPFEFRNMICSTVEHNNYFQTKQYFFLYILRKGVLHFQRAARRTNCRAEREARSEGS